MKTFRAVALLLVTVAAAEIVFAARYEGDHPYGSEWGLVEAVNPQGDYWPFRKIPSPSGTGGNNLRDVTVTYPDSPFVYDNSSYGDNPGDYGVYTTSYMWAPEEIYKTELWGSAVTVTLDGFVPNATYKAEVHCAETYNGSANRIFRWRANGTTVAVVYRPGPSFGNTKGTALAYATNVTANASGQIVFTSTSFADNSVFGGLAVWGTATPTWNDADDVSISASGVDVVFSGFGAKDVHRFYIESSNSENGPWTNLAVLTPGSSSYTAASEYNAMVEKYYRVVASNGVGTVSKTAKLGGASITYTDIATLGETIASDSTANYRVNSAGSGDLNKLGATATSAAMYVNGYSAAHTLAIASSETFSAGVISIFSGAGDMAIGDTAAQGTVSPLSGMLSLTVPESSTLTINAVAAKTASADTIAKYGAGKAVLAGGTDIANLAIGAGALEIPYSSAATLGSTLSGPGTFVKSGSGALTLNAANPNFTGTFEVKEGKVVVGRTTDAYTMFGGGDATVQVRNGGAFDVGNPNSSSDNDIRLGNTRIVFEGTGLAGDSSSGALMTGQGKSQYEALTYGELSGDGTVYTAKRLDFRNHSGGGFWLNGHTLTKTGSDSFYFTSIPVYSGGSTAKIRIEQGTFGAESSTAFNGEAGSFEMAGGGFDMYNLGAAVSWPLYVEATGGRISCRSGNYDNNNNWSGAVTIAEGGTLTVGANDNSSLRITGAISGAGALKRDGNGSTGYVKIENTANSYTGGTIVNYGVLYFPYPGALPGYDSDGNVTVSGSGKLAVRVADSNNPSTGWSAGQISDLFGHASAPEGASGSILIDTNGNDAEETSTANVDKPIGIGKTGSGTYLTKKSFTAGGGIFADAGTLIIDNTGSESVNQISEVQIIKSGAVAVTNAEICTGTGHVRIANVGNADNNQLHPRLTLGNGAKWYSTLGSSAPGYGVWVGSAEFAYGILEVLDGAVMTSRVCTGNSKNGQGAVYQRGGTIVNWGGSGNDGRLASGENSYGYWEVGGSGHTEFKGYTQLGFHVSGNAILAVKDSGEFLQKSDLGGSLSLSRGGTGVVYQAGGSFKTVGELWLSENNDNGSSRGMAVYNMCGGFAEIGGTAGNSVRITGRNDSYGQINLNGGVFSAKNFYKDSSYKNTSAAYAAFNGGTFKSTWDNLKIFGDSNGPLDGLYMFERGGTIDTDGHDAEVGQAILAPSGLGVKSITYTAEGLIGPPAVKITGDGTGATAVCNFDSASGRVTGITVTCPGWGYTTKPTVQLTGGGLKSSTVTTLPESAVAMGSFTAGPLVKKGEGRLTLTGNNGFAGVEVAGGMLDATGSTLASGPLTLSGGTFAARSFAATEVTVEGDADTVSVLAAPLSSVSGERASVRQPGLYTRYLNNSGDFDSTLMATAENMTCVSTNLDYAQASNANGATIAGEFPNSNLYCIYDGYIWNRSGETVTWTFGEHFDDYYHLEIDDNVVLSDLTDSPWTRPSFGTVSLSPGAHKFHLVLKQGGGTSGPCVTTGWYGWWDPACGAVSIDYQGRDQGNSEYFVPLADDGSGNLFTLTDQEYDQADFAPEAVVHVNGGTLKVQPSRAGLYSGPLDGNVYASAACPKTGVSTDLEYAQIAKAENADVEGVANNTMSYIYEGYIWNHGSEAVTWTFGENFDDNVRLTIDGAVVLNNDSYNTPTKNTVTLSPGPHAIRIGLYQGTGGSGPFGSSGWVVDPDKQYGIFVDFSGRDSEDVADYVPLTATCHGGANPLLTTEPYMPDTAMIPSGLDVAVSGSGTVDLGGGSLSVDTLYSGAAGITNGALTVTGDWVVDYADVAAGAILKVGSINLTGATLAFTGDASALDPAIRYTILEAEGAITGTPALDGLATGWVLRTIANKIVIAYPRGLVLIVR